MSDKNQTQSLDALAARQASRLPTTAEDPLLIPMTALDAMNLKDLLDVLEAHALLLHLTHGQRLLCHDLRQTLTAALE